MLRNTVGGVTAGKQGIRAAFTVTQVYKTTGQVHSTHAHTHTHTYIHTRCQSKKLDIEHFSWASEPIAVG